MRVNYCQLSVSDEHRHRGIALLNGVLKAELQLVGWGRSCFADASFEVALRKSLSEPGPLIINLSNPSDEAGDFYDYSPDDDRYVRITPAIFWHGLPNTRWPGLRTLLDPATNPRRLASPIFLLVWSSNGASFSRRLDEAAAGQLPRDLTLCGAHYPVTAAMLSKLSAQEQNDLATSHYYELEELCRLICRRERMARMERASAKLL